jgi:hypothetical protein
LVVDRLLNLRGITEGTLVWTRPNFFAFRYELVCSAGPVGRLTVHGIGTDRYALMETSEGCWRFAIFPLERREVPVSKERDGEGEGEPVAMFDRVDPASVRFQEGAVFRFQPRNATETVLSDAEGSAIFIVELVEAFPRWRADLKLEPEVLSLPEAPILLAAACCNLVFE